MLTETLSRIARRVADRDYDPRHAVLDVSSDILSLRKSIDVLPPVLQNEFAELIDEFEQVQPSFPSRRTTSLLFDRQALGQAGRERAERLIRRLVALARTLENLEKR